MGKDDLFADVRDVLAEHWGETEFIRRKARELTEIIWTKHCHTRDATEDVGVRVTVKALRAEVTQRAEGLLRPIADSLQRKQPPDGLTSWGEFAEVYLDPAIGNLQTILAKGVLLGLGFSDEWQAGFWLSVLSPAVESAMIPLVWHRQGTPVHLVYYDVLDGLLTWVSAMAEESGKAEDLEGYKKILAACHWLCDHQWQAAAVLGSLWGATHLDALWCRYALQFAEERRERWRRFFAGDPVHPLVCVQEVPPTTQEWDLVGMAVRYILYGEPVVAPVITAVEAKQGEQALAKWVVVNHPLIPKKKLLETIRAQWSWSGLTERQETLLAVIRECGGDVSSHLPRGFWTKVKALWNQRYPDDQVSDNALWVRYHRLKQKLAKHAPIR